MICRVCLLEGASSTMLTFTDGEEITLDLCENCVGHFEDEDLINGVAAQ